MPGGAAVTIAAAIRPEARASGRPSVPPHSSVSPIAKTPGQVRVASIGVRHALPLAQSGETVPRGLGLEHPAARIRGRHRR